MEATMNRILAIMILSLIAGCGGSGGDAGGTERDSGTATPMQPNTITCEHDGDLWLCNEQNSCIRDESTPAQAESIEEVKPEQKEPAETPDPVITPIKLWQIKFSSGAITIIAECGSSVNFSNSETTTTNEAAKGVRN
jgi:hypothetical protein